MLAVESSTTHDELSHDGTGQGEERFEEEEEQGRERVGTKEDVIVTRVLYANLHTRRFEKDVPDNMENVEPSG